MWQKSHSSFVCGVQHDSCPITVREALARLETHDVCHYLRDVGIEESMVLSTCNRFEVYGYGLEGAESAKFLPFGLARLSGLAPEELMNHTYHKSQDSMIRHGFGVAASVHSMVVGEPQILGQMKEAWQTCREAGHTGTYLDRFANTALRVGKRARTETAIASEAVSVASLATRLAEDIYGNLNGVTVLLVGVNDMTKNAAQHLKDRGVQDIILTNRSLERAQNMAPQFNAHVAPFGELPTLLTRADIILTSTSSSHYLISKNMVKRALKLRKQSPMLFVDMAIPRDVEPQAHELENCYVYDMDSLSKLAKKALSKRQGALGDVLSIIDEETHRFMSWVQTRQQATLIKEIRTHFYKMREDVLNKCGNNPEEATRMLVNKLLHSPSENLRNTPYTPEQISMLKTIFLENNINKTDK